MIAAFIAHALLVSALCGVAAWLLERNVTRGARVVWALAIAISFALPILQVSAKHVDSGSSLSAEGPTRLNIYRKELVGVTFSSIRVVPPLHEHPKLEFILAVTWLIASCAAVCTLALSTWNLSRCAKRWKPSRVGKRIVHLSGSVGPAVFGIVHPRIVVPQWFVHADPEMQKVILSHEQQHIRARDPLLYFAALIAVCLFPWNLPLHWQLRRLRFALEIDCDRRVTQSGVDPFHYAEMLIRINQQDIHAPVSAMALIDRRASRLERRIVIMTTPVHRYSKIAAALLLALSAACVYAAAKMQVPTTIGESSAVKPPPVVSDLGRRFEEFFASKYPALFTEAGERTPIVAVLVNSDASIAQTALFDSPLPIRQIHPTTDMFTHLGLEPDDVPYVGAMAMQSATLPNRAVLVVYTERKVAGRQFVSALARDSRAVDREIFKQYFAPAVQKGVPAGQRPWVLCDRSGQVLRTGMEAFDPSTLNTTLESRFAGIRTEEITVTPVTDEAGGHVLDADGNAVQLASVWLAPGSPAP